MRLFFALLLTLSFLAANAGAVVVSRLYNFEPDTPAEAEKVDAEFDNIVSAINGNLNGTDNIAQNAIATGNIASFSVTHAKMGALGQQISSSSGLSQRNSDIESNIPNMTGNISVVSRPVWVGLQAAGDGPGRVTYRHNGAGATDNAAYITFRRAGISGVFATVNQSAIGARLIDNPTNDVFDQLPCSSFWFIDAPTTGNTYNYTATFRTATSDSGVISVENCKLVIFEL